jgi:hypothetical protein
MKLRIQKVCLPKKIFEALPPSVRMIIANDSLSLKDDGNKVCFELTVGIVSGPAPTAGLLYTNTYFCDRDKVEWRLTGSAASDQDSCPDCGRSYTALMSEVDSVLVEYSQSSLEAGFGNG